MLPTIKTTNQIADWSQKIRPKVGESVQYSNAFWQNTSGINTEPGYNSTDWMFICEAQPYYKGLKITKNINNKSAGLQPGDSVSGQRSEVMFWTLAFYMGGDPEDDVSFDVVIEQPLS